MIERPILFSAPMVRAILEGSKVQTRRPVKPQPGDAQRIEECAGGGWMVDRKQINFPYAPGMRLWVRETHWMDRRDPTMVAMDLDGYVVARSGYETGQACAVAQLSKHEFWRKRPSIHMPRWASRILLEVTAVRVERLQDISDADAQAEGIDEWSKGAMSLEGHAHWAPIDKFELLWNSINGAGSWGANPWVWVVEFRRVEP